jgi:hypothetical protein
MPRGFLVKRTKNSGANSYRVLHKSDHIDSRSESGSSDHGDMDYMHTNFGSPDSGYSASPVAPVFREKDATYEKDYIAISPASSPLTVTTSALTYPSPFYYFSFDRMSMSSSLQSPIAQSPKRPESTSTPATPASPHKRRSPTESEKKERTPGMKKPKAARKLNFSDDIKSSPVSGTFLKDLSELENENEDGKCVVFGDIDSVYNFVEITPEAKADLDKIENKIGAYICQLCKDQYDDAFSLAQHRCPRIVHVEYRCPECDKVFNCPANLASHRRWHKPRPNSASSGAAKTSAPTRILPANPQEQQTGVDSNGTFSGVNSDPASRKAAMSMSPSLAEDVPRVSQILEGQFECSTCGKKFRRQAYLRKHVLSHSSEVPLPCQFCNKLFPNENARARHEAQHIALKDLSCPLCHSVFPNKLALDKHVRSHTNEVFTCKYCSSTFYSSPGLTRHINKCHPSENRQVILLQIPGNRNN